MLYIHKPIYRSIYSRSVYLWMYTDIHKSIVICLSFSLFHLSIRPNQKLRLLKPESNTFEFNFCLTCYKAEEVSKPLYSLLLRTLFCDMRH